MLLTMWMERRMQEWCVPEESASGEVVDALFCGTHSKFSRVSSFCHCEAAILRCEPSRQKLPKLKTILLVHYAQVQEDTA